MKAREVVLLIFIIIAGVFFYHAKTGKIDWEWHLGDFFEWDQELFTYEETQAVDAPLPSLFKVVNAHGNVEIQGVEGGGISITMVKKIWRRTEEEASEIAGRLHAVVTKDDLAVTLSTNREEFKRRNFETDFRISLPLETAIDVTNRYGLVRAVRVASAAIDNSHGQVVVSEVPGNLMIVNSYEDVEIENIQSGCEIRSRHSNIQAAEIAGEMRIENSYGSIRLRDIGQKITIEAPHTEIRGEDLPGALDIQNSYEKIALLRVGPLKIDGHHSRIEAAEVNGDVIITDNYEPVTLSQVRGKVQVTGKSMSVSGKDIVGEEIYVSSSYEPIDLRDFAGKTTILLSHGELTLRPLALTGPVEARCDYTPIVFFWPGEELYPLEAQTKNSDIRWQVGGEISIEEKNGLTVARAFSGIQDKPRILLITTYNDIQVEKGIL
jgi:DUF4097 and DUF4098 domain-containing protein YvlB